MYFLTYGDKTNRSLLFIHGMATTATQCYGKLLPYFSDYYVILCEVDGHSAHAPGDFISIDDSCEKLEDYVLRELGGELYGICGLSMGATLAVELLGRGRLDVQKTLLDAAFTVKMGVLTKLYASIFAREIQKIQRGGSMPKLLSDIFMGKGNTSIGEMLYMDISQQTLKNACCEVYTYGIPESLSAYKNPVMFWRGEREQYPKKSARLLRKYLPQMQEAVFPEMGHAQYLHQQPDAYAAGLLRYFC